LLAGSVAALLGCRSSRSEGAATQATAAPALATTAPQPADAGPLEAAEDAGELSEATATRVVSHLPPRPEPRTREEALREGAEWFPLDHPANECRFHGRVRAIRPTSEQGQRASLVLLDESPDERCSVVQLRGDIDPAPADRKPLPAVRELVITLEKGLALPLRIGEVICGSHRARPLDGSRDLDLSHDALIARPDGAVLIAYSVGIPRDASPAVGWTFKLGAQRTTAPPGRDFLNEHDVVVSHAGAALRAAPGAGWQLSRSPEGDFQVRAWGGRVSGPMSDYYAVRERTRYGFAIVRGSETQPAGDSGR
jgi:hypothetical protein